ncbi:winged helix DNA-binding domain-containing protein [Streptacidiphilus griseoplanus]|uniref:winged helix DNA-binding domain-containing protein n=1 Tax=Peterkaempfera griseoplana TaxID=66896 RepID=UPI0006E2FDAD|nr:winged helix DNA-binding domain-containing protein [Peterkaempfera griseoplana]
MPLLSRRALNRATLARQLLLDRSDLSVTEALEHLVGLQAQTPHTWYVGLWTRLAGFRPEHAADLLLDRRLVRTALMRSTIHLVTAADCLALRPVVQPALDRDLFTNFLHRRPIEGLDLAELVAAGRAHLDEQPLTPGELGALLGQRWPDRNPASLAYAVRNLAPLVQVPPRGVWGSSGQPRHATAEHWLGRPLDPEPAVDAAVLRFLAAFGPATVKDIQTWSGLTRLREVVERLRPRLAVFTGEQGEELWDLPEAPRPDPDTPAPPRFLYDFDNLLLSHADRSRVLTEAFTRYAAARKGPVPPGVVLLDGFSGATWRLVREKSAAALEIRPLAPLGRREAAAVAEEGERLLAFAASGARSLGVRWLPEP